MNKNNIRKISILLCLVMVLAIAFFTSCQLPNPPPSPTPSSYKVTYNLNYEGANNISVSVDEGKTITKPNDPIREGYAFDGWYINSNCTGTPFAFTTVINKDTTLYAKWNEKVADVKYNFIFDINTDDTVSNEPDTIKVDSGQVATKPTDPSRAGYMFGGWYMDANCTTEYNFLTNITQNTTVYAKWIKEVKKHTITFVYNNGTQDSSVQIEENTKIEKPEDPIKERYRFDGWYLDEGLNNAYNFESNVTIGFNLYAKYTKVIFDLILNYNYDAAPSATTITTGTNSIAAKPQDPIREGFTFSGWYQDAQGSTPFDFAVPLTEDRQIYAAWKSNEIQYFEVTFDYNYLGSVSGSQQVVANGVVTKPQDPVREGFRFKGWFVDAQGSSAYSFDTIITSEKTIYASWEEIVYKSITYNYNYVGTENKVDYFEENTIPVKIQDPIRLNYTFAGWTTSAKGGDLFDFTKALTEDVILYAQWIKTYVYEAEDTNLQDFDNGFGFSGGMSGTGCIVEDISEGNTANASGNRFVTYLNNDNEKCKLDFVINSDRDITTNLIVRMSAEIKDITIVSEGIPEEDAIYEIKVNDDFVGFSPIQFVGVPSQSSGIWLSFRDIDVGEIMLKTGENHIVLKAANSVGQGGTMYSTAPMIDCIKISTSAILTWTSYAELNYGG